MVEINYEKSIVKRIGNFGFEIVEMVGSYAGKYFKVTLSSSPYRKNDDAKCVEGNLTRDEIIDVLKKFNYMKCETKIISL